MHNYLSCPGYQGHCHVRTGQPFTVYNGVFLRSLRSCMCHWIVRPVSLTVHPRVVYQSVCDSPSPDDPFN